MYNLRKGCKWKGYRWTIEYLQTVWLITISIELDFLSLILENNSFAVHQYAIECTKKHF